MPIELKPEVTATSYAIEVPEEEFIKVTRWEDENVAKHQTISEQLITLEGVSDIEYNGHFGPYFYFTVEKDFDNAETHKKVQEVIRDRLKEVGIDAETRRPIKHQLAHGGDHVSCGRDRLDVLRQGDLVADNPEDVDCEDCLDEAG